MPNISSMKKTSHCTIKSKQNLFALEWIMRKLQTGCLLPRGKRRELKSGIGRWRTWLFVHREQQNSLISLFSFLLFKGTYYYHQEKRFATGYVRAAYMPQGHRHSPHRQPAGKCCLIAMEDGRDKPTNSLNHPNQRHHPASLFWPPPLYFCTTQLPWLKIK